jgi:hypothetical protein
VEIRIAEESWIAELIVSPQSEMAGFMHCTGMVTGKTQEHALEGARIVLDLFAKGRNTFIRTPPEANSETDFDTKETHHLGYVRFSVRLEAGSWNYPSPHAAVTLGLAEARG